MRSVADEGVAYTICCADTLCCAGPPSPGARRSARGADPGPTRPAEGLTAPAGAVDFDQLAPFRFICRVEDGPAAVQVAAVETGNAVAPAFTRGVMVHDQAGSRRIDLPLDLDEEAVLRLQLGRVHGRSMRRLSCDHSPTPSGKRSRWWPFTPIWTRGLSCYSLTRYTDLARGSEEHTDAGGTSGIRVFGGLALSCGPSGRVRRR